MEAFVYIHTDARARPKRQLAKLFRQRLVDNPYLPYLWQGASRSPIEPQ